MNNEIKEILDYLENDKNYNCDCNDGSYYLELPYREAHELKDCITNLQKENEHLDEVNCQLRKKINNDIYKSRNEKAIEHLGIDEDILKTCEIYDVNGIEVYKILQGSDK